MSRLARGLGAALFCLAGWFYAPSPLLADSGCQFVLGFATMAQLVPQVGSCLDNQTFAANGDAQQHTTNGLLVWRKRDNWTAFTDGYRTWLNGPNGIQQRLNTERFDWEGMVCADVGDGLCIRSDTRLASATQDAECNPADCLPVGVLLKVVRGQWLLKVAAKAGVRLVVAELPVFNDGSYLLGQYDPRTKTVTLASPLVAQYHHFERPAVLVHELRHAAQDAAGQLSPDRCMQNEFEAFQEEGWFWAWAWHNKLPNPQNSIQAQLNDMAMRAATDPYSLVTEYAGWYHSHVCG